MPFLLRPDPEICPDKLRGAPVAVNWLRRPASVPIRRRQARPLGSTRFHKTCALLHPYQIVVLAVPDIAEASTETHATALTAVVYSMSIDQPVNYRRRRGGTSSEYQPCGISTFYGVQRRYNGAIRRVRCLCPTNPRPGCAKDLSLQPGFRRIQRFRINFPE